jgi:hypothetical protein
MDSVAVAWTVLVSIFLGFAFNGVLLNRMDRLEAEAAGDVEAAFIVEARERKQIVRVIGWLLFVVVGIVALLPLPSSFSVVTLLGLFVGIVGLGMEDVLDQIDRYRFRRFRREQIGHNK